MLSIETPLRRYVTLWRCDRCNIGGRKLDRHPRAKQLQKDALALPWAHAVVDADLAFE